MSTSNEGVLMSTSNEGVLMSTSDEGVPAMNTGVAAMRASTTRVMDGLIYAAIRKWGAEIIDNDIPSIQVTDFLKVQRVTNVVTNYKVVVPASVRARAYRRLFGCVSAKNIYETLILTPIPRLRSSFMRRMEIVAMYAEADVCKGVNIDLSKIESASGTHIKNKASADLLHTNIPYSYDDMSMLTRLIYCGITNKGAALSITYAELPITHIIVKDFRLVSETIPLLQSIDALNEWFVVDDHDASCLVRGIPTILRIRNNQLGVVNMEVARLRQINSNNCM